MNSLKYSTQTFLYFQIEIRNFLPENILNYNRKKYMAAAAPWNWRDKQNCAVKWLFGKTFIFIMCHSQSATLPVHYFICFFICQCACFILLFSTLNIFQGFSLNRCQNFKGRPVDKLLNSFQDYSRAYPIDENRWSEKQSINRCQSMYVS